MTQTNGQTNPHRPAPTDTQMQSRDLLKFIYRCVRVPYYIRADFLYFVHPTFYMGMAWNKDFIIIIIIIIIGPVYILSVIY